MLKKPAGPRKSSSRRAIQINFSQVFWYKTYNLEKLKKKFALKKPDTTESEDPAVPGDFNGPETGVVDLLPNNRLG